jgi:hypothetical protein
LDADVDGFGDFPTLEEDSEALTQHYEPGCILGFVEEVLLVRYGRASQATRKMIVCLRLARDCKRVIHDDIAYNGSEGDSSVVLFRSPMRYICN